MGGATKLPCVCCICWVIVQQLKHSNLCTNHKLQAQRNRPAERLLKFSMMQTWVQCFISKGQHTDGQCWNNKSCSNRHGPAMLQQQSWALRTSVSSLPGQHCFKTNVIAFLVHMCYSGKSSCFGSMHLSLLHEDKYQTMPCVHKNKPSEVLQRQRKSCPLCFVSIATLTVQQAPQVSA